MYIVLWQIITVVYHGADGQIFEVRRLEDKPLIESIVSLVTSPKWPLLPLSRSPLQERTGRE